MKRFQSNGLAPPLKAQGTTSFAIFENKSNDIGPPRGTNSQLVAARDNMVIGTIGQIG